MTLYVNPTSLGANNSTTCSAVDPCASVGQTLDIAEDLKATSLVIQAAPAFYNGPNNSDLYLPSFPVTMGPWNSTGGIVFASASPNAIGLIAIAPLTLEGVKFTGFDTAISFQPSDASSLLSLTDVTLNAAHAINALGGSLLLMDCHIDGGFVLTETVNSAVALNATNTHFQVGPFDMNLTGMGVVNLTHCIVANAPHNNGMTINDAAQVTILNSQFTNYGMLGYQTSEEESSDLLLSEEAVGVGLKVGAGVLHIEGSSFYNSPNLVALMGMQENMSVYISQCTVIYCGPIVFESFSGINSTVTATIEEVTFISAVGSVMNITEGTWDLTIENVEVQTSYGSSFVFLGPDISANVIDCFFFHITSTAVEGAAIFAEGIHSLQVLDSEFSRIDANSGSAIYLSDNENVLIEDCTFESLTSEGTGGGGAIYAEVNGGTFSVNECLFSRVSAAGGSAIELISNNDQSKMNVSSSQFIIGKASWILFSGCGGVLYVSELEFDSNEAIAFSCSVTNANATDCSLKVEYEDGEPFATTDGSHLELDTGDCEIKEESIFPWEATFFSVMALIFAVSIIGSIVHFWHRRKKISYRTVDDMPSYQSVEIVADA